MKLKNEDDDYADDFENEEIDLDALELDLQLVVQDINRSAISVSGTDEKR